MRQEAGGALGGEPANLLHPGLPSQAHPDLIDGLKLFERLARRSRRRRLLLETEVGQLDLALLDHGDHGLNDPRIELRSGLPAQLVDDLVEANRGAVRPLRGHGMKGSAGMDDAPTERNLLAGQPIRVAPAVAALI